MTPDRISRLQSQFPHLLGPISRAYARVMRLRARLYKTGKRASWRPPAPCISVGNISWGGTGKTPVVSWLLDWARDEGLRPTVLTRGYGGKPPHLPYAVQLLSTPREAGDEPLLLKRTHPQAQILVDPDRVRAGKIAARKMADLFVLDDGYQHLRIQRDLNLCLMCPRDLDEEWDRVIPAGSWREDVSALARADAFLINTMFDDDGCLETVAHIKLAILGKPIFFFRVTARGVANALTGETQDSLDGRRFLLVTAIANPDKVCQTCQTDLGEKPVRHLIYPDHHPFGMSDWQAIVAAAERNDCSHIVCTPKDAVKLAPFADERLWTPLLTTSFSTAGPVSFRDWLGARFHNLPWTLHAPEKQTKTKFSKKSLLAALRQSGAPMRSKNIYGLFDADASLKKVIKSTLAQMVESGEIAQMGKSYGLMDSLPRMTGTLDVRRSGVGYLIPETKGHKDLFIHPSNFGGAWPGDKVVAVVDSSRKKDAPEGRVVEILERATSELLVRVTRRIHQDSYFCHPTDSRMPFYTVVDTSGIPGLEKGDILSVRPEEEQEKGLWRCTALRRLGVERDLATQELLVKTGYSIPEVFPAPVLKQASALPEMPSQAEWEGRNDLRRLALVTIDGETAKDFDDAVYVERQENGYRLVVAIADVAHYVPEGSPLDVEALARGNSYYFPLSVEPMFPEALSNGLCSLRPHVPRLAMVVDTPYSLDGEPGASRLYNAVIESHARLTYTQVQAALDGSPDQATTELLPMLSDAEALAKIFMQRRMNRGCLDFDIPEAQVRVVEDIVSVHAGTRLFSHRLIEEFMIAANERVAEYMGARKRVFPYRIHPQPDEKKLETLLRMLSHTSLVDRLPGTPDQKGLQQISHAAKGTDMEYLVNRLILRTMMQAQYSPENEGHYGLASAAYCHFTSPIRRYADLMVHRSLKRLIADEPETMGMDEVQSICENLNALERKAMEAEREIQKRSAILALEDRIGETMRGVISGVADFGFWVELLDMPVDGLVRLATLDDYYVFDPERQDLLGQRTGKTYAMGQTLDVVLEAVSLERVEINFTLP